MTATPEGPDESRPASEADAGTDLPPGVVVPDDARDLELDRQALLRERAVARRRAKISRLVFTRRWHSHGISGPIVAGCLFVVFVFAVLLALMVPSGGNGAHASLPLATSAVPAGARGSLLPAETLKAAGRNTPDTASRELRPGLLLVVPDACATDAGRKACTDAINNAAGVARDYDFKAWLVGSAGNTELATLAEARKQSTFAVPFADPSGAILAAFPATTTPTAVFIDASGLVTESVREVTGSTPLTSPFDRLGGLA